MNAERNWFGEILSLLSDSELRVLKLRLEAEHNYGLAEVLADEILEREGIR